MLWWTERALADLVAIGDYIAADSPVAARSWVEKIRERAAQASNAPRAIALGPPWVACRDDVQRRVR